MEVVKLYFKSDFKLLEKCEAGYSVPFQFRYYTNSPKLGYVASYDGHEYSNCEVSADGETLTVAFDDHKLGLGKLMVERRYYLTDADYASGICDEVITPAAVVGVYTDEETEEEVEYNIVLGLEGAKTLEAQVEMPAYYQKGEKGDTGATGATGPAGPAGQNGRDGLTTAVRVNGVTHNQVNGVVDLGTIGGGASSWGNITGTLSDQTDLSNALGGKVDKVEGKGLSANDYTTAEKTKLAGIAAGADVTPANVVVDASYNHTDNNYTDADKTEVGTINQLAQKVGELTSLTTTAKNDLVSAINEVNAKPSGGGSSGKQGVISQTQNWLQASDGGYDYTMSNVVRGTIPQEFIDRWNCATNFSRQIVTGEYTPVGCFNETSGYFEYEKLKDISYKEALDILEFGDKSKMPSVTNVTTQYFSPRTLIYGKYFSYDWNSVVYIGISGQAQSFCHTTEYFSGAKRLINSESRNTFWGQSAPDSCKNCWTLKELINMNCKNKTSFDFTNCVSLVNLKLYNIKCNIDLHWSQRLSKESLIYMINYANTTAITITLHANVYAKCVEGGEWYDEVSTALASKTNITLASA